MEYTVQSFTTKFTKSDICKMSTADKKKLQKDIIKCITNSFGDEFICGTQYGMYHMRNVKNGINFYCGKKLSIHLKDNEKFQKLFNKFEYFQTINEMTDEEFKQFMNK